MKSSVQTKCVRIAVMFRDDTKTTSIFLTELTHIIGAQTCSKFEEVFDNFYAIWKQSTNKREKESDVAMQTCDLLTTQNDTDILLTLSQHHEEEKKPNLATK